MYMTTDANSNFRFSWLQYFTLFFKLNNLIEYLKYAQKECFPVMDSDKHFWNGLNYLWNEPSHFRNKPNISVWFCALILHMKSINILFCFYLPYYAHIFHSILGLLFSTFTLRNYFQNSMQCTWSCSTNILINYPTFWLLFYICIFTFQMAVRNNIF